MEMDQALDKVRKLINKAEHPDTDPAEAKIYRAKADANATWPASTVSKTGCGGSPQCTAICLHYRAGCRSKPRAYRSWMRGAGPTMASAKPASTPMMAPAGSRMRTR